MRGMQVVVAAPGSSNLQYLDSTIDMVLDRHAFVKQMNGVQLVQISLETTETPGAQCMQVAVLVHKSPHVAFAENLIPQEYKERVVQSIYFLDFFECCHAIVNQTCDGSEVLERGQLERFISTGVHVSRRMWHKRGWISPIQAVYLIYPNPRTMALQCPE